MSERPDSRIWFDPSVTDATLHGARKGQKAKDYLEKVAMLVPVEVLVAYRALLGFVPALKPETWWQSAYWICFGIGVVATGVYTGERIGKGWKKVRHIAVYIAAFIVWAYAISGDKLFKFAPQFYQDAIAGMLLVIASLFFGAIKLPAQPKLTKR